MDLLTRGAGFGYLGSTLTSLIYATFTLVYFAFEGAIMAQGVTGTFGIPLQVSYVIVALAVIPLVTYGMSFLAKFQAWSWPVWLVLLVLIGLVLMEAEIFTEMAALLAFYSNVAVAWIVAVFADLTINRKLGLSPVHIEHKRGLLYRFNPVGFASMVIASVLSIAAYFGAFGDFLATYSTFGAAILALVLTPLIALATQGAFYIRRGSSLDPRSATDQGLYKCRVCAGEFEAPDMLNCPFHKGPICSLCCTVESQCNEVCKAEAVPARATASM